MQLPVDLLLLTRPWFHVSLFDKRQRNIVVSALLAMLQTLFVSMAHAESTGIPKKSGTGLYLFMDANQQQQLDQPSVVPELTDFAKQEPLLADEPVVVTEPDSSAVEVEVIDLAARYDGVVLKGNRVLGVWLNHKQLPGSIDTHGIDLTATDTVGGLLVDTGTLRKQIVPGDYLSIPKNSALSRLMAEIENTYNMNEAVAENGDAAIANSKIEVLSSVDSATQEAERVETDTGSTELDASDSETDF